MGMPSPRNQFAGVNTPGTGWLFCSNTMDWGTLVVPGIAQPSAPGDAAEEVHREDGAGAGREAFLDAGRIEPRCARAGWPDDDAIDADFEVKD